MSSATSTEPAAEMVRLKAERPSESAADQTLQPWQFFVLAALICATVVTFVVRGQGVAPVVLLSLVIGASALAALAALRTVLPLVTSREDRTVMIGERTRAALEREKMLTLRSLKELEFDRAMGKVSDADFTEMSGRLRARAARLIRQLDASAGHRAEIERDLARRLKADTTRQRTSSGAESGAAAGARMVAGPVCAACSTANDPDARFCKSCGQRI